PRRGYSRAGVYHRLLRSIERTIFLSRGYDARRGDLDRETSRRDVQGRPGVAAGGNGRAARRPVRAEEAAPVLRGQDPRRVERRGAGEIPRRVRLAEILDVDETPPSVLGAHHLPEMPVAVNEAFLLAGRFLRLPAYPGGKGGERPPDLVLGVAVPQLRDQACHSGGTSPGRRIGRDRSRVELRQEPCTVFPREVSLRIHRPPERGDGDGASLHLQGRLQRADQDVRQGARQPYPLQEARPVVAVGLVRLPHHVADAHHEDPLPDVERRRRGGGSRRRLGGGRRRGPPPAAPDLNEPGEQLRRDGHDAHPPSSHRPGAARLALARGLLGGGVDDLVAEPLPNDLPDDAARQLRARTELVRHLVVRQV